ncbi:hypothetical protein H8959_000754 [Pygathrix nigripes]
MIKGSRVVTKKDEMSKGTAKVYSNVKRSERWTKVGENQASVVSCKSNDESSPRRKECTVVKCIRINSVMEPQLRKSGCFRRNSTGDREKALEIMLQVLQSCEHPGPDMFCLCGRIYKDIFLDSDCKDDTSRDSAIEWYRKGFELQSSLYSGINLAVLLIVAGQQFETSLELRKIGVRLNSLLGRKGSLEKMNNYWDVGQFFSVSMLASDVGKAVQAAERLFKLKPPVWYLRSLVQNLLLIRRFKKPIIEHSPRQERLNFWLDIIFEATNEVTNGLRFPKQMHEWNFTASSIKGISLSKFDERCCFLYVHDNSDDFQIYFSTEEQCNRFFSLVKEMITNTAGSTVELEGETDGDTLEYEYDHDANGERVVLGKGTYGIVYAGRDLSNQVRIAIKEIPERDSRQPLHEEIALHKYLKHRNIVQYLGSVSENGYIKIFMEQVPGGDLSALLRSKWGPMKEPTIKFYTKQILEGLKYLHENQIVHRDIKGDNVLVNTYSGVVKISDFGTSKRLAGVNPCTETFTGKRTRAWHGVPILQLCFLHKLWLFNRYLVSTFSEQTFYYPN